MRQSHKVQNSQVKKITTVAKPLLFSSFLFSKNVHGGVDEVAPVEELLAGAGHHLAAPKMLVEVVGRRQTLARRSEEAHEAAPVLELLFDWVIVMLFGSPREMHGRCES